MSNREKCKKALYEYIDSLDDEGLYEMISEQDLVGPDIYSCEECEKEYGNSQCDDIDICKTRFLSWIAKDNVGEEQEVNKIDEVNLFFSQSSMQRTYGAEKVFAFLNSESSIKRMKFCCELKIPAISGIIKELEEDYSDLIDFQFTREDENADNHKRNIGWMIRYIMKRENFKSIRQSNRIPKKLNAKYFGMGKIYELEMDVALELNTREENSRNER